MALFINPSHVIGERHKRCHESGRPQKSCVIPGSSASGKTSGRKRWCGRADDWPLVAGKEESHEAKALS